MLSRGCACAVEPAAIDLPDVLNCAAAPKPVLAPKPPATELVVDICGVDVHPDDDVTLPLGAHCDGTAPRTTCCSDAVPLSDASGFGDPAAGKTAAKCGGDAARGCWMNA